MTFTAAALCSGLVYGGTRTVNWPGYNGSAAQTHFSELEQINRSNVSALAIAWRFDTYETGDMLTNPVVISGTLYAGTPMQNIVALNAATGKVRWRFQSNSEGQRSLGGQQPIRGLAYWASGKDERILVGIANYLYALNARTGNPIDSFGVHGRVDLRVGLGRFPIEAQSIALTTPGIVYKNLIIVGGREPEILPSPPGDIRAYDVRTGALVWSFHTIPHPGEFGYDTWPPDAWRSSGSANNWAGMALDLKRGIVFVPTGQGVDYYGANRLGDNLFGNCLLALDAATGKRLWHFQAVRHDLWDRDLPAPPTLLTVIRDGRRVDAVAQITNQGFVFLFDRTTGQALFPIVERRVAASDVPGEVTAPTQPFPTVPKPFARQELTEDMLTTRTPNSHLYAIEQFRQFVNGKGPFVPLALDQPTVVFPGFDGGAEWGGAAVDPRTSVMYINSNDVAWTASLVRIDPTKGGASKIYQSYCAACHGLDRRGSPPAFPSLMDVGARLRSDEMLVIIREGKGRMPSFAALSEPVLRRLIDYLRTGTDSPPDLPPALSPTETPAYAFTGYRKFVDEDGYPAVAPPWGTLNAINLNTGNYLWQSPLGGKRHAEAILTPTV